MYVPKGMIHPEAIAAQGSAWIKKAAAEEGLPKSLKLPTNIKPFNQTIGDCEKQKKPAPTRRPEIPRASAKRCKASVTRRASLATTRVAGRM